MILLVFRLLPILTVGQKNWWIQHGESVNMKNFTIMGDHEESLKTIEESRHSDGGVGGWLAFPWNHCILALYN